jgi:hypothetical protein
VTRPSHTTVVAYLALFVALCTGGAYAANQLVPKKSVGAKQLKNNAVTTAKIKKNAVTKAKVKKGSIDSSKIADGSVAGTDLNVASTPFSRVVFEARGSATVALPTAKTTSYPLSNSTYVQEAGRNDSYIGAVDISFQPSCAPPRGASATILLDTTNVVDPPAEALMGLGSAEDAAGGLVSKRIDIGPFIGVRFERDVPTNHSIAIAVEPNCAGGTEGVLATAGAVDVIGTK